jgi:hypothetical protein
MRLAKCVNAADMDAFSQLNELHQIGCFGTPHISIENTTEGWDTSIALWTEELGLQFSEGLGSTKRAARAQAASSILDYLRKGENPCRASARFISAQEATDSMLEKRCTMKF